MKIRHLLWAACALLTFSCGRTLKDGEYTLTVLSTNDVHGTWFDSTYVDSRTKPSLMAVKYYVDSVRTANGAENVLLLDAGDCLQGDNAPYYFNYVDTLTPHLFPRLVAYMGYDAVAVGNHDIETGHAVYDRVAADLQKAGVDFLAANAIRNDNGKPYFKPYKIVKRAGLKVAILGYTNANMKAWLTEELWSGMHFVPIVFLSRSHPYLVKCLFKMEVPEIEDGLVEIKEIAREAGSRTKMMVYTDDPNIDPVGACVGSRGARVQNVVDELFNEKIDIIPWSEDPVELVTNALSPARVEDVFLDMDAHIATVVVPDYQLSLAIGKSGQNVRLAAKLCNWKIDIKSHTQYYGDDEEVYEDDYEMESDNAETPEAAPSEEMTAEEEE